MPYRPFLEAARAERYDIELLGHRFRASFEQVCHRLTTLRRPGAEGVPFHMVRIDIAGNISKRFSASGHPLRALLRRVPALERVHARSSRPGMIRTQLSQMPDGHHVLLRRAHRAEGGRRLPRAAPVHAIGSAARSSTRGSSSTRTASTSRTREAVVPVGVTCRLCERMDCEQRAFPPLQHPLDGERERARRVASTRPSHGAEQAAAGRWRPRASGIAAFSARGRVGRAPGRRSGGRATSPRQPPPARRAIPRRLRASSWGVYAPPSRPKRLQTKDAVKIPASVPCKGCILVVDDDRDLRSALTECFEGIGCTVIAAVDGVHAVECLGDSLKPCLVLLDLDMPRLDGAGLAAFIRTHECHGALPIVSMSAGTDWLTPPLVERHHCKPFDFGTLLPVIERSCQDPDWLHGSR